jgi:hypothetical protein
LRYGELEGKKKYLDYNAEKTKKFKKEYWIELLGEDK